MKQSEINKVIAKLKLEEARVAFLENKLLKEQESKEKLISDYEHVIEQFSLITNQHSHH